MTVRTAAGAVGDVPMHDVPMHDVQVDDVPMDGRADDVQAVAARLALVLGRLSRSLRRGDPSGIGAGSLSALSTLVRCGPMRLGDLAAREAIAPPTLSRVIATLDEAGYVVRTADPADRRATLVAATVAGQQLVGGTGAHRADTLRRRLDGLPAAERELLLAALPVLEALARDDAGNLHSTTPSANH